MMRSSGSPWDPRPHPDGILASNDPIAHTSIDEMLAWWLFRTGNLVSASWWQHSPGGWALDFKVEPAVPVGGDRFLHWLIEQIPERDWTAAQKEQMRDFCIWVRLVERTPEEELTHWVTNKVFSGVADRVGKFAIAVGVRERGRADAAVPDMWHEVRFFAPEDYAEAFRFSEEATERGFTVRVVPDTYDNWDRAGFKRPK